MTRVSTRILAPMIVLSLLSGQVVVTTQIDHARPAFEEATVAGIDPSIRHHDRRQLTTTTLRDQSDLLQLIVSAYVDADGAGACAMKIAFGYECSPIVGPVPEWMRAYKFEVAARFSSAAVTAEDIVRLRDFRFTSSARKDVYPLPVRLMLQRLLEETFDLKVRRERKEIPVWAITAGANEPALIRSSAAATTGMGMNGLVFAKLLPGPPLFAPDGSVQLVFEGSSVKDAADFFSFYLDRPVIDRTGLDGEYNFTLEFKGNRRAPGLRGGLPLLMAGFDAARLTMAFEGVGLKVESTTAPFEILSIDHVQTPPAN
ncbi:MAG: TIGR03435 family protein [Vicinamibacterales bacterium]